MRETVRGLLAADGTLMGTLTGGIYAGGEVGRQGTAGAFNAAGEILPCALVNLETEAPWGPYENSGRLFFTVTFYERSGYASIDAALARVYALLHGTKVGRTDVWTVTHADDVRDQEDGALKCSMARSRYVAVRAR